MVELFDTTELMLSASYKDRFKAEYHQTKIRRDKLKNFVQRIDVAEIKGVEEPKHDCPVELLRQQLMVMNELLDILEHRALIEDVDLSNLVSEESTNASK